MTTPFYLQKGNVFALPVLHTNMEMAALACQLFHHLKPACVAVELAETMTLQLLHGSSRLPDISVVKADSLYYLIEPCDALYETLRSAIETDTPAYCIDLDMNNYPDVQEPIPDPYAIQKIGLKAYYELYHNSKSFKKVPQDQPRELHMAKKLKELSLRYDTVLFICGMNHVHAVLEAYNRSSFPVYTSIERNSLELITPSEESLRHILGEWGWISTQYEKSRETFLQDPSLPFPDRKKLIFDLYKKAKEPYVEQGNPFPGYNLRNTMKFARNYALVTERLLPDLFQILAAAKGCVDHNYAYETWVIATDYPYYKNVDGLPVEDLDPEQIWGHSKWVKFHLKQKSKKAFTEFRERKDRSKSRYYPPGPFSICSYPPEDVLVENFGHYLKKKGTQILREQGSHTLPFSTSLEDGVDIRETIRHFTEKKLYVRTSGKPQGSVGSIVMIFDEDATEENAFAENYSWKTTWLGEHTQESDMAFYATHPEANIVGPGISRCEYGGFMMSYPPRRLMDVWHDPDYEDCRNKAEVLLAAAIDYSGEPIIVYVASKPPRSQMKSYARRFGKKVVYLPLGQLSPLKIRKLRFFHVLDGQNRREIAKDYIF